jgi:hypothetical protein
LKRIKLRNPETLELFSTLMGIVCVSVFFFREKVVLQGGPLRLQGIWQLGGHGKGLQSVLENRTVFR